MGERWRARNGGKAAVGETERGRQRRCEIVGVGVMRMRMMESSW